MDLAPVLTGCHVCRDPMVETINGWMKGGITDAEIERRLKEAGTGYSRNTIGKHHREHLTTEFDRQRSNAAKQLERQRRTIKGPTNQDLAVLVRDNVVGRMVAGELQPTMTDGLRAQQMLDTRAEKGADRDLALKLALVLGGTVPSGYIEGSYVEIDDEASEDIEELRLLGSGV